MPSRMRVEKYSCFFLLSTYIDCFRIVAVLTVLYLYVVLYYIFAESKSRRVSGVKQNLPSLLYFIVFVPSVAIDPSVLHFIYFFIKLFCITLLHISNCECTYFMYVFRVLYSLRMFLSLYIYIYIHI